MKKRQPIRLPRLDIDGMKRDMFRAARELLGVGYVPGYYESAASEFIQIAESYAIGYSKTMANELRRVKAREAKAKALRGER